MAAMDRAAALPAERRRLSADAPFRRRRRPEERMKCAGVWLDFVKPEEVMLFLVRTIAASRKSVIANHNAHSLYLVRRDPALRRFYEAADLVQVDSQPLILWTKLLGRPSRRFHRSTYLDWRDAFWRLASAEGWRVFFVGGAAGMAESAAERIRADWPEAQIAVQHGFFDRTPGSPGSETVLWRIEAWQPHVIMVGMGMPIQELWIQQSLPRLPNAVILPVGGAFDYEAGVQTAAPRWMGRVGIEWLFRLAISPKRMFVRYCIEPWFLLGALLLEAVTPLQRVNSDLSPEALGAAMARRGEWTPRSAP